MAVTRERGRYDQAAWAHRATMKTILRLALAVLSLLGASLASAAFPPPSAYGVNLSGSYVTGSSQAAACANFATAFVAYVGGSGLDAGPTVSNVDGVTYCGGTVSGWGGFNRQIVAVGGGTCPANSTGTSECTCNSGFQESGGQCVAPTNACTPNKGKTAIVNWTVGFTRSGDASDTNLVGPANTFPSTNEVCSGGCIVVGDPYAAGSQAWKSQAPTAQGLYRLSMDVPMTNSGDQCTAGAKDSPAVPTTPEPQCPGYVGEVNGKVGCYGTAERPVTTTNNGTPPPGPPAAGNPAAGPQPTSGEGSGTGSAGRTPSAGNGGNAGGPAAAATGGSGTRGGGAQAVGGTGRVSTTTGEEQAPCGAPGQPVCNVKVDETGTPSSGNFKDANEAMDKAQADIAKGMLDTKDMVAPTWSFSFELPTGCSAYQVASFKGLSFKMDPCAYQSTIHDLMSMIWAAVTAFFIIGMVGRTIRGES